MFSIIITVIAIALVAALIAACVYYGGQFATDGSAKAKSARYLQEGNQLVGALELYKSDHDGQLPTGTNEDIKNTLISGKYLKGWPEQEWGFTTDYAVRSEVDQNACKAVNDKIGISTVPDCSDPAYLNVRVCCTMPSSSTGASGVTGS